MKRYFCALLSLVALLSLRFAACAADDGGEAYDFSDVQVGSIIIFGGWEQDNDVTNGPEPIEWLVLTKEKGRILVISLYGLDCRPFNTEWKNMYWNGCSLRAWLNGEFLGTAFGVEEQAMIPTLHVIEDRDWASIGDGGPWDKVFVLTKSQADQYFSSDTSRQCELTAYAEAYGYYDNANMKTCWWWLRSEGSYHDFAALVNPAGSVDTYGGPVSTVFSAVRPAMWINLTEHPEEPVAVDDACPGDIIAFGSCEQDNDMSNGPEPIEWLVLEREEDRILAISRYALDCLPYSDEWSKNNTWEACSLRAWLNGEFLSTSFTEEEKKKIPTVTVSADRNPYYKTDPGNNTEDQVFLLSIQEAENYCDSCETRLCKPTAHAESKMHSVRSTSEGTCEWWLRSPGSKANEAAIVVGYPGRYILESGNDVRSDNRMVRPALWIKQGS